MMSRGSLCGNRYDSSGVGGVAKPVFANAFSLHEMEDIPLGVYAGIHVTAASTRTNTSRFCVGLSVCEGLLDGKMCFENLEHSIPLVSSTGVLLNRAVEWIEIIIRSAG